MTLTHGLTCVYKIACLSVRSSCMVLDFNREIEPAAVTSLIVFWSFWCAHIYVSAVFIGHTYSEKECRYLRLNGRIVLAMSQIGLVVVYLTLLGCVYAQEKPGEVSKTCLGCICEAASGCNVTLGCDGSVCGPFRITWGYWADSGKPTLNNELNTNEGAYPRCVNDPYCASRAVQGYMDKFAQDCNGDGVINCDDYIRIHRLGGYGCSGPLNQQYENTYKLCMQTFG